MKKILILLALTIWFMWSITFVLLPRIENQIDQMTPPSWSWDTSQAIVIEEADENISPEEQRDINNKEIVREKIEIIRKRLALKWLIIEGDSYYRDGQLPLALKKYLEFYTNNSYDPLIIDKLGDTYFEMKKFSSAYNYYIKIKNASDEIKEKTAQSLVLMTKIHDLASVEDVQNKLKQLELPEEIFLYHSISLSCSIDFHACKKDFWEYFWPESTPSSWSGPQEPEVNYKKLSRIKDAIINYKNFQIDEVYLKDAYLIWAWYSNGLYSLSAYLWEQLLEEKINYKPILKIVAQSYFELGEHEKAREVLLTYYEIDDEDIWVVYLLWIVNSKLREYVLANIYFNKALDLWYDDAAHIHRQLIHNFYTLENDVSMLDSFVSLIDQDNITQNDLSLWIYYHIIHEKYPQALTWALKWKKLFGLESGIFHAYEWWILTEKWKYEQAQLILQQGLDIDSDNPFVLINFGYNALARENKWEALIYFKKILSLAPDSEFAENATKEIEKLSQ